MDLLRRSFRASTRRRQREPLSESPSFDSPQEEQFVQLSASPMDRLRRSFRRSFRGCGQPLAELPTANVPSAQHQPDQSLSMMDRLRSSFRRSFRRKNDAPVDSPIVEPLPPTYDINGSPSPMHKLRRSFRRGKDQLYETPKTKSYQAEDSALPTATLDKLRRSFRRSLRRRKDAPIESSSKLPYWQSDEVDVRAGTCFFNVKYLGCIEVFEPRGILMCEEAFKMLKKSHKRPIKSILFVSANGLRVVEKNNRGLIVDQSIDMLSFCGPVRLHDRGFSFICLNVATLKWLCYCFIAKESGERLSNAVGCAFAIYSERKKKRDKESRVTMNFDLSSATFTRIGSFRRQSMMERRRDKSDVNTTTETSGALPTTTIININNNITADYEEDKENIPCESVARIRAHDFERLSLTASSSIRRQRSFRELSHTNHLSSPFRRQMSLRLRDLPSNIERMKSLSAEFSFDSKTSTSQFLRYRTPVSPIAEVSPANTPENNTTAKIVATDRMTSSAVRQQLSQRFTALSKSHDLLTSESSQLNHGVIKCSESVAMETNQPSQEANTSNSSGQSHHPSVLSSIESVTLTPPATPSPSKIVQLLEPDQWLSTVKHKVDEILATASSAVTLSPLADSMMPSSSNANGCHGRSYSLNDAEGVLNYTNDPFDIDWSVWTSNLSTKKDEQNNKKKKHTNPFLPSSPDTPERP